MRYSVEIALKARRNNLGINSQRMAKIKQSA